MEKQEELEATLAEAQAELVRAVADRTVLDPDPVEAEARLGHARAACRQARAALAQLSNAGATAASGEQTEKPIRRVKEPPERQSGSRKLTGGLLGALRGRHSSAPNAFDWRLLARQSLMLLALILAYLQYYFFDVQLQVSRLPSLSVFFLG